MQEPKVNEIKKLQAELDLERLNNLRNLSEKAHLGRVRIGVYVDTHVKIDQLSVLLLERNRALIVKVAVDQYFESLLEDK